MSDDWCPRQIVFTLPGVPGVQVTATEVDGTIEFVIDVLDSELSTGDLRALFFHINEDELPGLTITSTSPYLTERRISKNNVLDLGDGATLAGKVKSGFDVGLEWGTPGGKQDDINFPVSFTLSNTTGDLDLDDLGGMLFGAKLDSVGGYGGPRGSTSKLVTIAPFAPDAVDDEYTIKEDGAPDANTPSKTPQTLVFDVLKNDSDKDTPHDQLVITGFHEGPQHGDVWFMDGMIYYTPDLDYSGQDSFWYCVTDGTGNQDSAKVTINIEAVADEPLISVEVLEGSNVYETKLRVTVKQNDLDSSEYIDRIEASVAGGVPPGVTITPLGGFNPSDEPDVLVRDFVITFPENQDTKLDFVFTAVSKETSNGDEETATLTKTVEIDFTRNTFQRTFEANDRSIWSDDEAIGFQDADFFGINMPFSDSPEFTLPVPVPGLPLFVNVTADVDGHFKFGIEYDILINGGTIDAKAPVEITMDTVENVTTDVVQFKAKADFLPGLWFQTDGPGGYFKLDAVLDTDLFFDLGVTVPVIDATYHPLPDDIDHLEAFYDEQIVNITDDFNLSIPLPFGFQATAAFPKDVDATATSGTASSSVSGSDGSNNFIQLDLDVGEAASEIAPILAPLFNPIPIVIPPLVGTFTPITAEVGVGANLIQNFTLAMQPFDFVVVLEDSTELVLDLVNGITISNASSHDLDGDGLEYSLVMKPKAQLTNDTEIGINFSWNLDLLEVDLTVPLPVDDLAEFANDVLDLIPGVDIPDIPTSLDVHETLVDLGQSNIPVTEIDVLTNQFALQFQSQTSDMFVV